MNHATHSIKEIEFLHEGEEKKGFLIAAPFHNKLANRNGFVIHFTNDISGYDPRFNEPFTNAIMFSSAQDALIHGEYIVRTVLASKSN